LNIQDFISPRNQSQQDMREEWITHLIYVNRVGINRVLNKYGYSGELQPTTREDTIEAIEMLIEQNGTDAIRDLLMAQPEFEAIKQLLTPKLKPIYRIPINQTFTQVTKPLPTVQVMQNATGSETTKLFDISTDDLLKGALIFGILYLLTKE
jgi:hypothetical protein